MENVQTTPNPLRGEYSVLSFDLEDILGFEEGELKIVYVPDRDFVTDDNFNFWISPILHQSWDTPEEFCAELLGSLYNDVLPFYIQIEFKYKTPTRGSKKSIFLIKKQPDYTLPQELKEQI